MNSLRMSAIALVLCGISQGQGTTIAGCPSFPANSYWNTRVDTLAVDARSAEYVNNISASGGLRYDVTIPINIVPGSQPKVPININWPDESDPGPYPIPPGARIEEGSDRHVVVVDKDNCMLYEVIAAYEEADGSWTVDTSAKWSLRSNDLRPPGWTSSDAAGLPIMPGLIRWDEVAAGQITHALRFTAPRTQRLFIWPARHYASRITDPAYPPMGQRFRLKAGFDISPYPPRIQTILRAMKTYGIILADNGLPWEMQVELDSRWDIEELDILRTIAGSNMEAVHASVLMINPDSGEARQPGAPPVTTATINSPSPGSTLSGASATFTWNSVSGADKYWLDVGNSVARGDIWAGALTATSQTVNGLPCDGRTLYVQLWTHLNGDWQTPQRYTYTAASSCEVAVAQIAAPTPGSTLAGGAATFTWTAVSGADKYWLDVGNSVARGDIWAGALTATSQTVNGLPCDGRTLYVQLWTHVNGAWQTPQRYTYKAASSCTATVAQIAAPVPGSTLLGSAAIFAWNAVAGADNYWLDVGNSVARGDIWAGALTATSQTVNGLPCDGRTLYVQLWTHLNGAWQTPQRYTYTAASSCPATMAQIIAPPPGSTLISTTVTFAWNAVAGADNYWLDVGNSVARGDIWAGALTATSQTVNGLPCDGRTLYVQLWTHWNGGWQSPQRYTYRACGGN